MSRSPRSLCWAVLGSLLVQAVSCTLTNDSFTPTEIDALTPDAGTLPAEPPSEPSASPEPAEPVATAEPISPVEPDAGAGSSCQGSEQQAGCPVLQAPPPVAVSPECVSNAD